MLIYCPWLLFDLLYAGYDLQYTIYGRTTFLTLTKTAYLITICQNRYSIIFIENKKLC